MCALIDFLLPTGRPTHPPPSALLPPQPPPPLLSLSLCPSFTCMTEFSFSARQPPFLPRSALSYCLLPSSPPPSAHRPFCGYKSQRNRHQRKIIIIIIIKRVSMSVRKGNGEGGQIPTRAAQMRIICHMPQTSPPPRSRRRYCYTCQY